MDKIIVVNINTCIGCHTCALSCAVAHSKSKELNKAIYEKDKPYSRLSVEKIEDKTLPIQCRHCEDAPCIAVCPSKAISRKNEKSPVTLDNAKCIGCHACILICPFGVIKKGPDGKSLIKCDLCIERLEEGKNPACVESCPTKSIKFTSVEKVNAEKKKKYKVMIQEGKI
jgi:anaerobic carbon-monoxide dehydrogenase iron sulfur subunit